MYVNSLLSMIIEMQGALAFFYSYSTINICSHIQSMDFFHFCNDPLRFFSRYKNDVTKMKESRIHKADFYIIMVR